jgi:UDP-N-acetyl-D-glucosamine dehydrogenase
MRPILEKSGLIAGSDFALAYSPEREDPGNIDFETSTIPKLVGADSEAERAMAKIVYDRIVKPVMVPNTKVAEAAKLTENIFRWVNIGLVNELKLIFDAMDIDVWDVIDAAASKPFGFMPFYPGPGVGGHCIRIDPYYLTWKAREHGMSTRFIELAGEINIHMPRHVVNRLMEELNKRHRKALADCRVLLSGVAYKKNIDDMRESPAMELFALLEEFGAQVDFYDPFIPEIPENHEFPQFTGRKSIVWDIDSLKKYDAAVIATAHSFVDYPAMAEAVPLIIDTRNISSEMSEKHKSRVAKA